MKVINDISVCAWVFLMCWEAAVAVGWIEAMHKTQMSGSSEHKFEGWVSGELSGEILGWRHVRSLEIPDDMPGAQNKETDFASTCN